MYLCYCGAHRMMWCWLYALWFWNMLYFGYQPSGRSINIFLKVNCWVKSLACWFNSYRQNLILKVRFWVLFIVVYFLALVFKSLEKYRCKIFIQILFCCFVHFFHKPRRERWEVRLLIIHNSDSPIYTFSCYIWIRWDYTPLIKINVKFASL